VLCITEGSSTLSIWISKIEDGKRIKVLQLGKEIWELPELFKLFESWLNSGSDSIDENLEWIADIGFSPRDGANGGGPIISTEIMRECIAKNIAIYLSEYDDREYNT
jgi:hypothetical protein